MSDTRKVELPVERVGDRLIYQLDPQALARPGSCCNCNSHTLDLAALGALASQPLGTSNPAR